jgi:tRNA-modifying protein YgfZ
MDSSPYRIVTVAGPDRVPFLQGQLTQDLFRLQPGAGLPAAWCNPKGRVLVTGTLLGFDDLVGYAIPFDMADAVLRRLGMYRLRAKVEIALAGDDWAAAAVAGTPAPQRGVISVRHAGDRPWAELFGPADGIALCSRGLQSLDGTAWRRMRVAAGLPDIGAGASERYTPHMLNLDRIGALSFTKGCYTGQEVVARTEHLGSVKRRLARFDVSGYTPLIGDRLSDGAGDVGEVVVAAGSAILAMLPVGRHGESFSIGCGRAEPQPLPWRED